MWFTEEKAPSPKPSETETKPSETEAQQSETEAKPSETEAQPSETEAKPEEQKEGLSIIPDFDAFNPSKFVFNL